MTPSPAKLRAVASDWQRGNTYVVQTPISGVGAFDVEKLVPESHPQLHLYFQSLGLRGRMWGGKTFE